MMLMKAVEPSRQNSVAAIRDVSMTMFDIELVHKLSTKPCNRQHLEHGHVSINEENNRSDSALLGVCGLNSFDL